MYHSFSFDTMVGAAAAGVVLEAAAPLMQHDGRVVEIRKPGWKALLMYPASIALFRSDLEDLIEGRLPAHPELNGLLSDLREQRVRAVAILQRPGQLEVFGGEHQAPVVTIFDSIRAVKDRIERIDQNLDSFKEKVPA